MVLHHVVQVDAVYHEVHRIFAATGGIECKRPLAAQWGREESALRRGHRAWHEQSQIHKVAAVQRNLLHHVFIDHLTNRHGRRFDDRLGALHGDDNA